MTLAILTWVGAKNGELLKSVPVGPRYYADEARGPSDGRVPGLGDLYR
jgi:hypothetical protein